MKHLLKIVARRFGVSALVVGVVFAANAATKDNGYGVIAERNVFNLHDPPTNVPPPVTNPPPPNVKLTGITSMLGVKRACFMVSPPAERGKPPGKEQSYILKEGEREGPIEVLKIDQKAATVRIRNDGLEAELALDTSPTLPSGPGAGPPNAGVAAGSHIRPPPYRPYADARRQSADGTESAIPTPTGISSTAATPGAPSIASTASDPQASDMSLEQKAILTEIERQRTQPLVDQGLYPPIPQVLGSQNQQSGPQGNDSANPSFPSFPTAGK